MSMTTPQTNGSRRTRTRVRMVPPSPAQVNENPHDAFLRLGNLRVKKALRAIRVVGNLSSRRYVYSDAELKLINDTLIACVDQTMHRFERERPKKLEDTFEFISAAGKKAA